MERDSPVEWLTGLVLGAASVVPASEMVSKGVITGPSGQQYLIFGAKDGTPLASTDIYRFYIAQLPEQLGLMKIASDPAHNDILEHEAGILRNLQDIAADLDTKAIDQGDNPYNYGAFFPAVIESMVSGDGRFLVFLGFHPSIISYKQLQPIPLVLNGQRVDLQTVVWILGKSLKVLDFSHRLGNVAIGFVDASNLLLETKQHGIFFIDWSQARENPTEEDCRAEVAAMAKIARWAAGGTDTTEPPHDLEIMTLEQYAEFVAFLRQIMSGSTEASVAHSQLYGMINRIWPKEKKTDDDGTVQKRTFHQWETYSRQTN